MNIKEEKIRRITFNLTSMYEFDNQDELNIILQ